MNGATFLNAQKKILLVLSCLIPFETAGIIFWYFYFYAKKSPFVDGIGDGLITLFFMALILIILLYIILVVSVVVIGAAFSTFYSIFYDRKL